MRDALSGLPPAAAARASAFLAALDARLPGEVLAVWVSGSIALGDFWPRASDVDLVVVTRREARPGERARATPRGRPALEVAWMTPADLPGLAASGGGLGAVLAATLHRHGISIRGPRPEELVPDVGHAALAAAMAE